MSTEVAVAPWRPTSPLARWLWALILTALIANILTLFVPFIHMTKALHATEIYSLTGTVGMMWHAGLWVLAIIIVLFSVVFPFAKIAVIMWALFKGIDADLRHWLHLVERLGKWSMIDVFIVCYILALTNDQFFVSTEPKIGIYTFLVAILLSLTAGTLLTNALERDRADTEPPYLVIPSVFGAGLLTLASCSFIAVIFVPFIAIDDWLLKDTDLSIWRFCLALFDQGAPIIAVITGIGLIVLPAIDLGLRWSAWWRGRRLGTAQPAPLLQVLPNWTLLDVFLGALIVFMIEGDSLMSLEARSGISWLVVFLTCYLVRSVTRQRVVVATPRASAVRGDEGASPQSEVSRSSSATKDRS